MGLTVAEIVSLVCAIIGQTGTVVKIIEDLEAKHGVKGADKFDQAAHLPALRAVFSAVISDPLAADPSYQG